MFQPNNDSTFFPFPSDPLEPSLLATTNDPAFIAIYDYLRDSSKIEFNPLFSSTSSGVATPFFDDYQQSTTVNPVYTIPAPNGSRTSSQERTETQPIVVQSDGFKSGKIRIKTQPRSKFRPRTEKESKESSHFIRSESYIQPGYPSIHIEESWRKQKNIIEVTLVDIDKQPHPYTIDNKERKTSPLIFKENEVNSLYFHLTESDLQKEEKIFFIEYIKAKQDDYITKDLIKTRKLHQSMLCFTRFYQLPDGSYQRDESSTEYSCLMTEDYGDLTVEDVFPLYGPMCGNQKVCIESKGFLPKDLKTDLTVTLTETQTNWFHQIQNINKNRNNFIFSMPPYPYLRTTPAKVTLRIQYKDETIYESTYIYTRTLDEDLTSSNTGDMDIRSGKRPRQ